MAAIVCFPGVMYRGGAEREIRKYLIDNNYVEQEDTREKLIKLLRKPWEMQNE